MVEHREEPLRRRALRAASQNVRRMALNTWITVNPDWRDYTQRFRDLLQVGRIMQLKGRTLHVRLRQMSQPRYQRPPKALVCKLQKFHPTTFGIGPYPTYVEPCEVSSVAS